MTSTVDAIGEWKVRILPEYTADDGAPTWRRVQRPMTGAIFAFFILYGFAFAAFAPAAMVAFTLPIAALALACIWALPNLRAAPTRTLSALLFAFMVCLIVWPNYIAFAPPGLPWITMVRLTGFPLGFALLVCVSTSDPFRSQIGAALKGAPFIWKLFVAFTVLQLISIGLSLDKITSLNKFIVAQISWSVVFFASVYVFLKPGRVERMAVALWLMALFVGAVGIAEWRASHVLWADHIPAFLKIEDQSVLRVLAGNRRSGDGAYRVVSTFGSPLALGEYMALTMPFVIQFVVGQYRAIIRFAAAASALFIMFIAYISGARLGQLGCLLSILFFSGFWAILKWRRRPSSLLAPALVFSYPLLFLATFTSIFMVGRLRQIFWGTGAEYSSTIARQEQYSAAIPKVLSHPQGYGMGMGGEALNYSPFGFVTIDSYYLSVVLEYGIIGFLVFYLMVAGGILRSAFLALATNDLDTDERFLVAISISLLNFLIIKSVFSGEDNHSIIFMILGMVCALACRVSQKQASARLNGGHISDNSILERVA